MYLTWTQKYESKFKELGIWYEHRLIDDMVAQGAPGMHAFIIVWDNVICSKYSGSSW